MLRDRSFRSCSRGVVAAWHRAASLLQKLAFEEANLFWPPEQAIGLDLEALVAAYAKLMSAYYKAWPADAPPKVSTT